MPTNNSINLTAPGIVSYDGAGSFSGSLTTQHGMLSGGASNSIVSTAAATNGQLLIGSTGANPALGTLNPGTYANIVNTAGAISINPMSTAKFIVNPVAGAGTHTTISAAVAAASSGDDIFITQGLYTEDVTLKPGVNLTGFGCDINTVAIIGNCSLNSAGFVVIYGIILQTNAGFAVSIGTASAAIRLINCYINCTNNTALSITASSSITLDNCGANISSATDKFFDLSSGSLSFYDCQVINGGNSPGVSTCDSSAVIIENCTIFNTAITFTGTSNTSFINSALNTSAINVTPITFNASNLAVSYCTIYSGSASCLNVIATTAGGRCHYCVLVSGNTFAIAGTGSFSCLNNTFVASRGNQIAQQGVAQGLVSVSPNAGNIGERLETFTNFPGAVALTNNTPRTIATRSLTPGNWDISINASFTGAPTGTQITFSASDTAATLQGNYGLNTFSTPWMPTATSDSSMSMSQIRVFTATTINYYYVAQAAFTAGSISAYGTITATRVG